ncbi:Gfo/Idh/MocA family protein [Cohnella sp.]|uniref:Gfo/Idh/MocA family protein n=1 Tax=Cohnella sp. TaxID=1883426 RepID=UPI003568EA2A
MNQVKVALIGAGMRGQAYADYAIRHPEEMQIIAVADPNENRRNKMKLAHRLEESMCYSDWDELLAQPKLADTVFICTQDKLHFEPTVKAMEAGYHVLLEKPMSPDPRECIVMEALARQHGKVFSICHVLRYTNFFGTIKRLLDEGAIGRLMSIQHNENVGYYHQAHSFVRGNWRNSAESSPMILSKSCHDMDILQWLVGSECIQISSFGRLSHFKAEQAPAGAPKRCTDGCPVADECHYFAPDIYLTEEPSWLAMAISDDHSYDARLRALQEGPYGRCVYHCDNDVVDHQVVCMEFANEVTAMFSLTAFTKDITRTIKLMGTKGEIRGAMEKNEVEWIRFGNHEPELIDTVGGAGHGGGDLGLIRDFIKLVQAGGQGKGLTSAENSLQSHLMAFAAEEARLSNKTIHVPTLRDQFTAQSFQ